MSAHTLKHDVNIRDKRIRLRITRKNPTRVSIPRADVFAKCIEIENRNRQGNILGTLGRKMKFFRSSLCRHRHVTVCLYFETVVLLRVTRNRTRQTMWLNSYCPERMNVGTRVSTDEK